jgi:hypothetical protein
MKAVTLDLIKSVVHSKGYQWFDDKVNIGGIRTNDNTPDRWNDFIYMEYRGRFHIAVGTTRPGVYWLQHPERQAGVFVMCPGQHIDIWHKGNHHDYPALTQCKAMPGWRDNDRDNLVDPDKSKIYMDGQGVDFHHAHTTVKQVVIDKYSAGCQVTDDILDWNIFFAMFMSSPQEKFSYVLLEENDFINLKIAA